MSFTTPWVLLLLVIPVLLMIFEMRKAGVPIPVPHDHGTQKSGRLIFRLILPFSLIPAMILAVVVILIAGPLKPGLPKNVRELTNIELCLDVSGSMTAGFGEGSRYDAAMEAISGFTNQRKGDAFGLTIFGNEVLRWVPLTKDLSSIQNATPFLRPELLPRHFGGTEIGKGLKFCQSTLIKQEEGDRLIILLSDGRSADLGGNRPHQIGSSLKEDGIVLYSIFIGSGAAPQQLSDVTWPTGGEVFAVDNMDGLKRVFTHIDSMQPAKLKPKQSQNVDDFSLMTKIGLVLVALYQMALFGLRYTPW